MPESRRWADRLGDLSRSAWVALQRADRSRATRSSSDGTLHGRGHPTIPASACGDSEASVCARRTCERVAAEPRRDAGVVRLPVQEGRQRDEGREHDEPRGWGWRRRSQGGSTVGLSDHTTIKLTDDQIAGIPGVLIRGKEPRLCDRSGCHARNRAPQHRLRIRARVTISGENVRANDDTRRRLEHLGDVAAQADQSADAVGVARASGRTAVGFVIGELEVAGEAEALDGRESCRSTGRPARSGRHKAHAGTCRWSVRRALVRLTRRPRPRPAAPAAPTATSRCPRRAIGPSTRLTYSTFCWSAAATAAAVNSIPTAAAASSASRSDESRWSTCRDIIGERFGQGVRDGIEPGFATPTAVFEDDQPARHQAVDGVDHHEGIATGRLMNGGGEFGQAFRAEPCIDVSRHVLERQATERQHRRGVATRPQLRPSARERAGLQSIPHRNRCRRSAASTGSGFRPGARAR